MERECPRKRPLSFSLLQIQERTGINKSELEKKLNSLLDSKELYTYEGVNKTKFFIRDKDKMY